MSDLESGRMTEAEDFNSSNLHYFTAKKLQILSSTRNEGTENGSGDIELQDMSTILTNV